LRIVEGLTEAGTVYIDIGLSVRSRPHVTRDDVKRDALCLQYFFNIVTHMPIARQRLGKHIPEITFSTIQGHPLRGNGPINTHS
jgi:hypothetical protein